MVHPHKDTPESFWERMRLIHGPDVHAPQRASASDKQDASVETDGRRPDVDSTAKPVSTRQDENSHAASATS